MEQTLKALCGSMLIYHMIPAILKWRSPNFKKKTRKPHEEPTTPRSLTLKSLNFEKTQRITFSNHWKFNTFQPFSLQFLLKTSVFSTFQTSYAAQIIGKPKRSWGQVPKDSFEHGWRPHSWVSRNGFLQHHQTPRNSDAGSLSMHHHVSGHPWFLDDGLAQLPVKPPTSIVKHPTPCVFSAVINAMTHPPSIRQKAHRIGPFGRFAYQWHDDAVLATYQRYSINSFTKS